MGDDEDERWAGGVCTGREEEDAPRGPFERREEEGDCDVAVDALLDGLDWDEYGDAEEDVA